MAPPIELLATLEKKGLATAICATPAEALAELVIHERALRTGAATGMMILLLIEPEKSVGVIEVLDRVAVYAAHAAIWRYSPDEKPALSAWAPRVERAAGAPAAPRSAPSLRLVDAEIPFAEDEMRHEMSSFNGQSQPAGASQATEKPHSGPTGPILSQDELSMLLSDDWESHT